MVRVLQSLVVRLSSQAIQSESSKTGRSPRYGIRGKKLSLFSNKGGTTIFVLFGSRGF